jgi:hypothetical protein
MMRSLVLLTGIAAGVTLTASTASAQFILGGGSRVPGGFGFGPSVEFRPGQYYGRPGGTNFNPFTGSVYRPWAGVVSKPSGNYQYIPGTGSYTPFGKVPGTGLYQNPWSGNKYNPASGTYIRPGWGW